MGKNHSRDHTNGNGPDHPSDPGQLFRAPPHNIEAEQALLGAILVNNEAQARVASLLKPEDFYDGLHQQIYKTAGKAIASGRTADPITLRTYFETAEPMD